jgi:hypothetical protein
MIAGKNRLLRKIDNTGRIMKLRQNLRNGSSKVTNDFWTID